MRRALFAAVVMGVTGVTLAGSAAMAGQLNILGQQVPVSTEEGWQGLGGKPTSVTAQVAEPTRGSHSTQARPVQVRPRPAVRTDILGQRIPDRTSRP